MEYQTALKLSKNQLISSLSELGNNKTPSQWLFMCDSNLSEQSGYEMDWEKRGYEMEDPKAELTNINKTGELCKHQHWQEIYKTLV